MKIAFKETTDIQLKHPVTDEMLFCLTKDGKPDSTRPMVAVIYGKHTSAYKNAYNRLMKSFQKAGKKPLDATETDKRALELLVSCVDKFKNLDIETENGKLDPNNIEAVLTDAFWIRDQIDRAIVDLENFTQPA
jgi:hypothetical protein